MKMDRNNCGTKSMAPAGMQSARSADRVGLPGEMDGLENDLSKLGALISELRGRLDNVMIPDQLQLANPTVGSIEPRRSRCNYAEGLGSFRDRIKSNVQSLQDVLDRLDL